MYLLMKYYNFSVCVTIYYFYVCNTVPLCIHAYLPSLRCCWSLPAAAGLSLLCNYICILLYHTIYYIYCIYMQYTYLVYTINRSSMVYTSIIHNSSETVNERRPTFSYLHLKANSIIITTPG